MKEKLDKKYAELVLKRCFNNISNSLLIEYRDKQINDFVYTLTDVAKSLGFQRVEVRLENEREKYDYLNNTSLEDIKFNDYFDRSIWDKYAKNKWCILHIHSFTPNMPIISSDKLQKANQLTAPTINYYRSNNVKYAFPWSIITYPTREWADMLFPNDKDAFNKLYMYILDSCMANKEDPDKEWKKVIEKSNINKRKLNNEQAVAFHVINTKGTDLYIGTLKPYQFLNMDKTTTYGKSIMVNFPSYEVFTVPNFKKVNGIVYSTRPLVSINGIIDDFYLEFKDGKVSKYKAKVGEDILKSLLEFKGGDSLGEFAIVEHNSPISNINTIFYNTLLDENSSIHLALGKGNPTCLIGSNNLTSEEIYEKGVNSSGIHEDFMIGSSDTNIESIKNNEKKLIFENGKFIN